MTDYSLRSRELGVQTLADVVEDGCEGDAKFALIRLLLDNLSRELGEHQQTVYGYLGCLRQGKV